MLLCVKQFHQVESCANSNQLGTCYQLSYISKSDLSLEVLTDMNHRPTQARNVSTHAQVHS